MQTKKVVLLIVEGISDQTSLALILSKLINNENVKFHIVGSDVTSDRFTTPNNAIEKVNDEIKKFLDKNKFEIKDIKQIIHLVDMDGAYISNSNIIEDKTVSKFIYEDDKIITNNYLKTEKRNQKKSSVINKLSTTPNIRKVPYMMLYFSCNLEHVLHNIRNAEYDDKDNLAEKFIDRFFGNECLFIEFIQSVEFAVEGDYSQTWRFIKQNNNSLNRYSNFHLFLNDYI